MGLLGDIFGGAREMQSNLYELLNSGSYGDSYELRRMVEDYDNGTSNYNLQRISRDMQRRHSCTYGEKWIVGRVKAYLGIDDD